ncbi:Spindle pole body component alp4 [Neolecta irregularis DAH-3]|uniref:Spindle pole body component n=1 Tax=Neolecta irregularis (strain DAH-3) TaxID=1198029 RepID=A0A1U7LTF1_NEOID|nr:Spindle pole body component alp4 [Neolecta irregularis DAH-3]|eukprot:OLL25924.1 Spindle pole body component alp4 [Neolecta irregularis DAH-3]
MSVFTKVIVNPHTTAPLASRIQITYSSAAIDAATFQDTIEGLSLEAQESIIISLQWGFEGDYIKFVETYDPQNEKHCVVGPAYRLVPGLDPSLSDLTYSVLKMASWFISIETFVNIHSKSEYGSINHSLCASIRNLLKEYLTLVAQLEHQYLSPSSITLHALHLHTLPMSYSMFHINSLVKDVLKQNMIQKDDADDFDDIEGILNSLREGNDIAAAVTGQKHKICKGGAILGLLAAKLLTTGGDPNARKLLCHLLHEASKPYMTMLNDWLHRGEIKDPHQEFMIKEQKSIKKDGLDEDYTDEYWEKRYTIKEVDIPPQLESVKEQVLLAGKYLNVVRECGGVDVSKRTGADVPKTFDDQKFLENINSAYAHANASLLSLLISTHELPARLQSLKHYFFLDQSDFFTTFLDLASHELKKAYKQVSLTKLQSLLDLSIRMPGSIAASDPFKDDIMVDMNEVGLTEWLMKIMSVSGISEDAIPLDGGWHSGPPGSADKEKDSDKKPISGMSALQFNYKVPFPLSLVISRKAVLRYQLLLRHLISMKYLEQQLGAAWLDHMKLATWRNKSSHQAVEKWKTRVWALRARMLIYVQQLSYFSTTEVVEKKWLEWISKLGEIKTVDQLLHEHIDTLDTCLKECMLTNTKLLKIHTKIMSTCTIFAQYTSQLARSLTLAITNPDAKSGDNEPFFDETRMKKLEDVLRRYEENFTHHLKILMDALNYYAATETSSLLGLVVRLDWNQI